MFIDSFRNEKVWYSIKLTDIEKISSEDLEKIIYESSLIVVEEDPKLKVYKCFKDISTKGWVLRTLCFETMTLEKLHYISFRMIFKGFKYCLKNAIKKKAGYSDRAMFQYIKGMAENNPEQYRCACGIFGGISYRYQICPLCYQRVVLKSYNEDAILWYNGSV